MYLDIIEKYNLKEIHKPMFVGYRNGRVFSEHLSTIKTHIGLIISDENVYFFNTKVCLDPL